RSQRNTEFEIIASDSIEDKPSALNVEASLKVSFLGGLVEVKGSTKYLKDTKNSKNQARVTLKYRTTTNFMQLTMNHLGRGNVKYPYVFEQGTATHVVTAVLYGAQAFFVFDHDVSKIEDFQNIEGNLQVMIKKIPLIAIEGEGSLQMTDAEKASVEQFSCRFYGDFALENNPVSFQDAIKVYAMLPKLLGEQLEHAVPMRVWLYPLKKLDSAAAQIVRQISIGLVNRVQNMLENFVEIDVRCSDLMKDSICSQFLDMTKKIKKFKEMCLEYKLVFRKSLSGLLPSIRGGGKEESLLVKLFIDFAEANKDKIDTVFITASSPNKSHTGASIYLYEEGIKQSEHFEPLSKPDKPVALMRDHESITLQVHPPKYGSNAVSQYFIYYSVQDKNDWKLAKTSTKVESFRVTGLLPNTGYKFKYQAVCQAGMGPTGAVSDSVKTLATEPPGQPSMVAEYCTEITISWKKPTIIGDGVMIQKYIVEYKEHTVSPGTEDKKYLWMKMTCADEHCTITGLQKQKHHILLE
ncbi:STXB protein, partial [Amia calva]|nr:STXB protein [Amia calva]